MPKASVKRSRPKKRVVLDIGSSAVRLCELTNTKTGYQLTKYYQREFLVEPSVSEAQRQEMCAQVVSELLKEAKVRSRKVIFGVPGQSVFTRTRALPPVAEHKVPQIVRYEIQQQIPFSLDQIALDYQVLARTDAGGYDVLMAAIKVDVVEKRLDVLKETKRSADCVDVCPIAAYNWLKYTGEFGEQGECVALIDLGAATTDIVIERDHRFRFFRALNLGGNDVTSAISSGFGMSFSEAEKLKREKGFAPTGDPQRDGRGGEVIGQILNRLVSEINRSFAYFRSQPGGGPVSRVIVTGGGACLRNIIPFLQRQLGMEVRIAQPLAGLAIGPGAQEVNEHPEQAAVVLGLALRSVGNVAIGISLIPPRILEQSRLRQQYVYWGLSLATLLLILGSIIPDTQNRIKQVKEEVQVKKNLLAQYDPQLKDNPGLPCQFDRQLDEAGKIIKELKVQVDAVDGLYGGRKSWVHMLDVINQARANDPIWISLVETTNLSKETQRQGGGGQQRLGGGQTLAQPQGGGLVSSGFRGIEDASPKTGSTLGGDSARPARGMQPAAAPNKNPPPNALMIRGFARDEDILQGFEERLAANKEVFVKIYLNDRSINPENANALGVSPMGIMPSQVAGAPTVVSFVMYAQYAGKEIPL